MCRGNRVTRWTARSETARGQVLVEVLISLLIFSFISVAFMGGIYTSLRTTDVVNEQVVAQSLTRIEMEYLKTAPYWGLGFSYEVPGAVPPWDIGRMSLDPEYAGYSVSVSGIPIDSSAHNPLPAGLDQGMQLLSVQVFRSGEHLLTTDTVKVNR